MRVLPFFSFLAAFATILNGQDIPSSFDLRDYGLAPAIQDQGSTSICWAVASASAIQSNLLKKELITAQGDDLYISPWHMAANSGTARCLEYNSDAGDYELEDGAHSWGGDAYTSNIGYLTRGKGSWSFPAGGPEFPATTTFGGGPALLEHEGNRIPYEAWVSQENLQNYLPSQDQSPALLTRGLYTINVDDPNQQANDVKKAITHYGAVTTGIYIGDDEIMCNEQEYGSKNTFYYISPPASEDVNENHEVTIIGWDDNYTINEKQGAWIVQNSWGKPDSGEEGNDGGKGVFYVSYDDLFVGKSVTAFDMELPGRYNETVLQHDPVFLDVSFDEDGEEESFIASVKGYSAATLFDLESLTLGGLGLLGSKDDVISVNFYDSLNCLQEDNQTIDPAKVLYSYEIVFSETGYTLFDLDDGIILPDGSRLLIVVDYGETPYDIQYSQLHNMFDVSEYEGLSYYLSDEGWNDFAMLGSNPGVFFVKGFTLVIPEPSSCLLFITAGAVLVIRRKRKQTHGF